MPDDRWKRWIPTDADEEPRPPYPDGYLQGLALWNGHQFWDCHEALEEIWLELDGGPKLFYQAIIQGAAAYFHVVRTGRWHAARHLFDCARQKMSLYPARYMGLDTADLADRFSVLRDLAGRIERGEAPPENFGDDRFFELWPADAGVPVRAASGEDGPHH